MRSVLPRVTAPAGGAATDPSRTLWLAAGWTAASTVLFSGVTLTAAAVGWLPTPFLPSPATAAVVVPLVAAPTAIRVLAHSGPAAVPAHTVVAIRTGLKATLYLIGAGLVLVGLALLVGSSDPDAAPVPVVASVIWLIAGLGLLVSALVLHSGGTAAAAAVRPVADRARPDLFDDAATLAARAMPGSPTARGAVWLNRGLDGWAWSPRRHRTGFVLAAAVNTGVVAVVGREFAVGPWSDPVAPALLALCTALVVAGVLAAGITWLGLLRPQPK